MSVRLATCGECRGRAASRRLEGTPRRSAHMPDPNSSLGDRIENLLQAEKFPPPADFAARARVRDPDVYEQAAADAARWWAAPVRERLHSRRPFAAVLVDCNRPVC